MSWWWLLACVVPGDTGGPHSASVQISLDVPPAERVDLLVIGAGPAGLTAAWAAQDAGQTVLVLEREAQAGGAGPYGRGLYAVDTAVQARDGVVDDVETALAEWETDAPEGDGGDETVQAFVEGTAEVVDWIEDTLGLTFISAQRGGEGRVHVLDPDGDAPTDVLADWLEAELWLSHEATGLLVEDGTVVGAAFTELGSGERGWVAASRTLVATGGFARHLERVARDRPDLDGRALLADHAYVADGGGLALLDEVGDWQNAGGLGVYLHSAPDPRSGYEGESLTLMRLDEVPIVDEHGARFVDETRFKELTFADALPTTGETWAIYPQAVAELERANIPVYQAPDSPPEWMSLAEIAAIDDTIASQHDDAGALADHVGLDSDGLQATLAAWDAASLGESDDDWRDDTALMQPFGPNPLWALRVQPASSKAFSGFRTDGAGRVLDSDGAVIPGLYAAGEVTGMLGTAAVGRGWEGSVTACYWMGWRIGATDPPG